MAIVRCPFCGSSNIVRIGLYQYECEDCGEVFDVAETLKRHRTRIQ